MMGAVLVLSVSHLIMQVKRLHMPGATMVVKIVWRQNLRF